MIRSLLILFGLLGVLPPLIGCLWTGQREEYEGSLGLAYLYGLFTMLAVFQVLAIPLCYLKSSLTLLCRLYLGVCLALGVLSLIRNRSFRAQRRWILRSFRFVTPLLLTAVLCMGLQGGYVTLRQHVDEDDAFYLATATTAVEYDGLYTRNAYTGKKLKGEGNIRYILASWPIFLAMLSKTSALHATVLAHMLIPAVVLFWVYLVYFLIGKWLFPEDREKFALFLLFVVALFSFSGYSIYSAQVFPLIRSWQGKAVLAGMGLPAVFWLTQRALGSRRWTRDWTMLFLAVGGVTCFTTIGSIFACITAGACALIPAWKERSARPLLLTAVSCLPAVCVCAVYVLKGRL